MAASAVLHGAAVVRVARAIHRMVKEGVPEAQAVAKAHAMEAEGKLRRDGSYVRVPVDE